MFCQEAGEKKSVLPEEGGYISILMGEEKAPFVMVVMNNKDNYCYHLSGVR